MPGPLYPIQANFTRGELSPRLFSRVDIDHWRMGLAECVNWIILKQGGLRRRPGTEWINETKVQGDKVRLEDFVFNAQQAYVLEFGNLYVRFYANGGIVNKNTVTGLTITIASPGVVTWTTHGLSNDDPVFFSTTGTLPTGIEPGVTYYVVGATTNTFKIAATVGGAAINTTGSQLGIHSAVSPVELATPYDLDDIWNLQFNQSADVLYIASPKFAPRELTRLSASEFTFNFYVYLDGPYLGENSTSTTMQPSDTSGNVRITASSILGVNGGLGFVDSDVGRPISIQYSSKWYWAQITSVGNVSDTVTFNTSTEQVTWTGGLIEDDYAIVFATTGTLPTPLVAGTTYYAKRDDDDNFKLSLTQSVRAVDNEGTVRIAVGHPGVFSWTNHGASNGDEIVFEDIEGNISKDDSGADHGNDHIHGITEGTTYYIINASTNTFNVASTPGGNAIGLSGSNINTGSARASINLTITFGATINLGGSPSGTHSATASSARFVYADVEGLVDDTGDAVVEYPGTDATGGWKLGGWSDTTGWPKCVSFFQGRIVWARTDTQPQSLWFSKAGELNNFATTIPLQADDGITLTILSGHVDEIVWIAEGKNLLIGTTGSARTVGPADLNKAFSASNVTQSRESTFGSKPIQPVQVGEVAVYASYYGRSLREFLFSFQQNSYVTPELTILSEHMLRSGIQQFAYQQDHESIIWNAMGNGELVGVTYDRDQQIVAMTRQRIGGHFLDEDGVTTPYGIVESVTCIPGDESTEVWLSVKRTINSVERRYIERMTIPFEDMDKKDGVFVDSSFTYRGAATTNIQGVSWLKQEHVAILADGAVSPSQVVNGQGAFTLANGESAETVTFGLNYTSRAKTLPISQGTGDGTGMGRRKNIVEAKIDVMDTGYLEVGSPNARAMTLKIGLREAGDAMDSSPPLKDDIFTYRFDRQWRDRGQVVLQTDQPLPATIRSIIPAFDAEP